MSYEMIIAEKPAAAAKIAMALGKPQKKNEGGVPYYIVSYKGRDIVVGSAVGHVYSLVEKEKKYTYPVFDIKWEEASKVNKSAKFTASYVKAIKKLAKNADEFTIATDYDVEGEVIGYNVLRFACKQKDGKRMKFSTLTKPDLVKSYENKENTINWGQALAGLTRHELDWYYGINLSRALTSAIKKAGRFKVLSIGRVQGPALKIVVDRELEIKSFKPVPYWQIELKGLLHDNKIEASYHEDKIWEKEKADNVIEKTKGHDGKIVDIKKRQQKKQPPFPFDLTSMQIEAYKLFKISPKKTLEIAQELYTSGYISYPRTSSQELPKEIGYKKILKALSENPKYNEKSRLLMSKKELKPNNGKKKDPAHPAIYPTGIMPKGLEGQNAKVYDLIVKRFLATFGDVAIRETVEYHISVNDELFIAKGTRTIKKGWHIFYEPYVRLEEQELPKADIGDIVKVKKISMFDKETQPPNRYTQASLIKELEKRNLGTKATRAAIIETLYDRGYIEGKQISATEFGIKTIETLKKHSPTIIDEKLTRHFEEEMELISKKKKDMEDVLEEAKSKLVEILDDFKKKEIQIGKELLEANNEAEEKSNTLGKCPKCGEGILILRGGKYGQFVKCNNCEATFNIPQKMKVKPAGKNCPDCNYPMVSAFVNKRKQDFCFNPDCPSKQPEEKAKNEGMKCPKCKTGTLVLRKGMYGSFLGCSNFPKCRYTEKIGEVEDPYL